MATKKHWCGYCGESHSNLCARAKEGVRRIDEQLGRINAIMVKHGVEPLTSRQMEARADRLRSIGTGVLLNGGKLTDGYRN